MISKSLLTLVALAVASSSPVVDIENRFEEFARRFERAYESLEERAIRFKIFAENLALIEAENAKNLTYTLGVTRFADLTYEEWRSQMLVKGGCYSAPAFHGLPQLGVHAAPQNTTAGPDTVDWVAQGYVTSVKNQGHCGSCWSFSAAGALEGAAKKAGKGLVDLSEQNILDCDAATARNKCGGGSMMQAFGWVKTNGICELSSYPYECGSGPTTACKSSQCNEECTKALQPGDVTGFTPVASNSESALESAVASQPVSVAIEADKSVFQHYTQGLVTSSACGTALDHGVLAVGYGVDGSNKYWKVKNSWGAQWGESGYVRILRGSSVIGGECGILKQAAYPHVGAGRSEIVV